MAASPSLASHVIVMNALSKDDLMMPIKGEDGVKREAHPAIAPGRRKNKDRGGQGSGEQREEEEQRPNGGNESLG
ncbi:hypothetical protein ACLOJK_038782 [Asimina triloba]